MRSTANNTSPLPRAGLPIQTASANGDMVWAFSLKGNPKNRIAQLAAARRRRPA